jgi:hypothetical protein
LTHQPCHFIPQSTDTITVGGVTFKPIEKDLHTILDQQCGEPDSITRAPVVRALFQGKDSPGGEAENWTAKPLAAKTLTSAAASEEPDAHLFVGQIPKAWTETEVRKLKSPMLFFLSFELILDLPADFECFQIKDSTTDFPHSSCSFFTQPACCSCI